jgi:carboxyl-terminal processing protease
MPRRNLLILLLAVLVTALCQLRVQHNPYGRVLAGAIGKIERQAYEPVPAKELFEGAMSGMLGRLDDYSSYIPPADLPEFQEDLDRQFGGIGIQPGMDPQTGQLMVVSPLAGWPAARAGVRAGDRILRIGTTSTQGMSLADAFLLLRGNPGEAVKLLILHEGEATPREISLVREIIHGDTVLGDTRNADGSWNYLLEDHDGIAYLRIIAFTDDTVNQVRQLLAWLAGEGMRAAVLDLRDNPGGYLGAAVDVCDLLVPSGEIVRTQRRDGRIKEIHTATGHAPFAVLPLAVLINDQTASAAEIVAACLQDHRRAAIAGQRTFGKGTVQELIYLEQDCGAMKLTTSSYWRPSGKNIHRLRQATDKDDWGVRPDKGCEVMLTDKEAARWRAWRTRRDVFHSAANPLTKDDKTFVDRLLLRAVQWLEKRD